MRYFSRLSTKIPAAITVAILVMASVAYVIASRSAEQQVEVQIKDRLAHRSNFLQSAAEMDGDFTNLRYIDQLISSVASYPDLVDFLIVDNKGQVVRSYNSAYQDKPAANIPIVVDEKVVGQALSSRGVELVSEPSEKTVAAYIPICTRASDSAFRATSCGYLLYRISTIPHFEATQRALSSQALFLALAGVASSAALALILHLLVSVRAQHLTHVARAYLDGDRRVRSRLRGGDELAVVGQVVDAMLDEIMQNETVLRQSKARYRQLLESLPVAAVLFASDRPTFMNEAFLKLFGFKDSQDADIEPWLARARIHQIADGATARADAPEIHASVSHAGAVDVTIEDNHGHTLRLLAYRNPIDLQKQEYLVTYVDVTERERARDKDQLYGQVWAQSSDYILIVDLDGRIIDINPSGARCLGKSVAEIIGQNGSDLLGTRPPDGELESVRTESDRTGLATAPGSIRLQSGEEIRITSTFMPLRNKSGEIYARLVISRDISQEERKKSELETANRLWKNVLEGAGHGVLDWDLRADRVSYSKQFRTLLGYDEADDFNPVATWPNLIHPDYRSRLSQDIQDLQSGRIGNYSHQIQVRCKDGSWKWVLDRTFILEKDLEGRPVRAVGTYTDLTDIKRADVERSKANERYSSLMAAARDPIIAINTKGVILLCNNAAVETFGYEIDELVGAGLDTLLPASAGAEHATRVEEFFKSDVVARSMAQLRTVVGRHKSGKDLKLQITLSKSDSGDGQIATAIIRDVTEFESLREQLQQADKLAAVGQLTGGVAHDINNMLAVILSSAEMLADSVSAQSDEEKFAKRIIAAAVRGTDMTRRLLAFSRKANIVPEDVDFSDVLSEIISALRLTLGGGIDVRFTPPAKSIRSLLDRTMFESCIINLAVNARDAMTRGGILTFKVAAQPNHERLEAPGWAVLTISDTGCGMTEDVRRRVFEPFFTTKPKTSGTGLGLPMVYGFVQQSGGSIEVSSKVGVGSTFTLKFPLLKATQQKSLAVADAHDDAIIGHRGLLVEDNEAVRESLRDQLENLGCEVVERSNFQEAREAILSDGEISFVLSDLDLGPGPDGLDLAEWMMRHGHNIPGAIMSGFLDVPIVRVKRTGWAYAQKAVQNEDLRKLLSEAGPRI